MQHPRVHVTRGRSLSRTIVRSGRKPSRTINQQTQGSREELSKFLAIAHYVGLIAIERVSAEEFHKPGENACSRMHTRAYVKTSSLTSYLGNANIVLRYVLPPVLWFTGKDNRPARSLWRHYPVRLESIFSTLLWQWLRRPGAEATGRSAAVPHGKTTSRLTDKDYRFGTWTVFG